MTIHYSKDQNVVFLYRLPRYAGFIIQHWRRKQPRKISSQSVELKITDLYQTAGSMKLLVSVITRAWYKIAWVMMQLAEHRTYIKKESVLSLQFRRAIFQRLENNQELVGFQKYPAIPNLYFGKAQECARPKFTTKMFQVCPIPEISTNNIKKHGIYLQNGK